jgi:NTP pyrophosphatase (non-canonical NTP hydrolase)
MSDLKAFQDEVCAWGLETFPNSKIQGVLKHLGEENAELAVEATQYVCGLGNLDEVASELADILILICRISGALGIDLLEAATAKMEVNRARKWKGGRHVKDEATNGVIARIRRFKVTGTNRVHSTETTSREEAILEAANHEVAHLGLSPDAVTNYCEHRDGRIVVFDPEDDGPAWFTLLEVAA